MSETQRFYSRFQDGSIPITIAKDPAAVYEAGGLVFTSARQLLIALTGHPEARNWTFDRYFKTGRHTPPEIAITGNQPPDGGSVIDLFGVPGLDDEVFCIQGRHFFPRPQKSVTVTVADRSPGITVLELLQTPVVDEGLTVGPHLSPESGKALQGISTAFTLGIDLKGRWHEVIKLLFKGFGRKIHSAGYNPEDVIQEVFKGILIRNQGKCPWDARKSSFGHYVWLVCSCVMSNYHRKQCRRRAVEQIGLYGYRDGKKALVDAGSDGAIWPKGFLPQRGPDEGLAIFDLHAYLRNSPKARSPEGRLAIRLMPLAYAGFTQAEMAMEIGVCKMTISKALDLLKDQALHWGRSLAP
jgi:hypothetical protein